MTAQLTGQPALDALARETVDCSACPKRPRSVDDQWECHDCPTCKGSGRSIRFPRLSRPCERCGGNGRKLGRSLQIDDNYEWREGYDGTWQPCDKCVSGRLPLPLDTAAVGPLLETLWDMRYCPRIGRNDVHPVTYSVVLGSSLSEQFLLFPTPEAALLAALVWAKEQA